MPTGRFAPTLPRLPVHTLLGLSLIVITCTPGITATSLAQTEETAIIVDTADDELGDGGNDCSLREAIQAANTDSPVDGCPAGDGDDAILLPAGSYVLTLAGTDEDANATGDLDILTGTVILIGPGPERTVVDGNQLDRVLHVHDGATVEIHGIWITQGRTPGGYPGGERTAGGGIFNAGTLLLSYSTVHSNSTGSGDVPLVGGGHGGGIYNLGTLTLDHSWIVANITGSGGGGCLDPECDDGADGGYGGGVYNHGSLILLGSTISDNRAGPGGTGELGGRGGWGGGVYNSGTLTLIDSTIDNNQTGYGGTGAWAGGSGGLGGGVYNSGVLTLLDSTIDNNQTAFGGIGGVVGGDGGSGGGIYSSSTLTISNSVIMSNTCGGGGHGQHSYASGGRGGGGGGLYNDGTMIVTNSSVLDNISGQGGEGIVSSGGPGGGIHNSGILELSKSTISGNRTGRGGMVPYYGSNNGGHGGGIDNSGVLTVTDCTVSGNTTGDGSGGENGISGSGGGICNSQTLTLRNSTISYNTAGSVEGDGIGGGIYTQGALTVTNTILAGNTDVSGSCDCYQEEAMPLSLGYNLVQSVGTCVFTAAGDLTGTSPLLAPLGDYGGGTFTHALGSGSPAIDQGSCRDSLTDQRGFRRPIDCAYIPNADDGCDIGAFEFERDLFPRIYLPLAVRHARP